MNDSLLNSDKSGVSVESLSSRVDFSAPWQSIETAPRDGSVILVLTKEYENETYSESFTVPAKIYLAIWYAEGDSWVDGKLVVTGIWLSSSGWFQPDEVTHWSPLLGLGRTILKQLTTHDAQDSAANRK